ncbi:MAG: radical SAM protein [Bacteroidales bacterium]|nr:radical SAM protein [Bacteroidales bacterium]
MAGPLQGLLAPQHPVEGERYRLMRFVVRQPVEEGLLLYHVMTKSLLLLDKDEADALENDPSAVPGLVEGWFAVPESHDDLKLAREVRAVGRMLSKPVKGISNYTILTTTDCNARCFYCYEKGRSRIPMSDEIADATARHIIKNSTGETIRISWFGGEPLFNKRIITSICSKLTDAGVSFRSSMVSNGLLFDEGIVAEAVDLWKLKKVQITLDGTEEVYNRVKNYVNLEGNAFREVLRNIHLLVDAGVRVSIRLNIDRHNADDLFVLADNLGREFGGNTLVSVYSHSLFKTCDSRAAVSRDDV